jgi:hypothetical protein
MVIGRPTWTCVRGIDELLSAGNEWIGCTLPLIATINWFDDRRYQLGRQAVLPILPVSMHDLSLCPVFDALNDSL